MNAPITAPSASANARPTAAHDPWVERVGRLRGRLADEGWAAALVLDRFDIRYLTGLVSTNAALVVTLDRTMLATDFRYVDEARALGLEVEQFAQGLFQQLGVALAGWSGSGKVAYDPADITHRAFLQLTEGLGGGVSLRAVSSPVGALRIRKEPEEIDAIRRSAALLEGAYGRVVRDGLVGRTEREVAWAVERHLRDAGADGLSFPSIVACGGNGAFPHHSAGDAPIGPGTLVTIDIGCVVDGYASDCTRTFATGALPEELETIYEVTLAAQLAALAALAPGRTGAEIDAVARDHIAAAGYGDRFGHGLGHGVGLEVHEGPRLARTDSTPLEPGMVVTVEPGIYLPGIGGVRIEDMVVVGESHGRNEILTGYPKTLTTVE